MYRFEKELKDKLIQRSNAKITEEACLVKMFKYFDYADKGAVNFNEFTRVMIKTGMYFPEEELRNLFNEYDLNGNGLVDYREFTLALFGQQTKNKAPVQK